MRYSTRLAEAGIDTSAGSVGDNCDNALAETFIGLFKTEIADHLGPRETIGRLEWETLRWVHWYNRKRLHGTIGNRPSDEAEAAFHEQQCGLEKAA